jgi:hypothetical protein
VATGEAPIDVGARSAVFAPVRDLGLIIIDEAHDNSYKQEEEPRYRVRTVAEYRLILGGGLLLEGSATPMVESMGRPDERLRLSRRASGAPPEIEVVDMRRQGAGLLLAPRSRDALAEVLRKGEQAIILLNRRGFAGYVHCETCGHVLMCADCELSLTYHKGERRLLCHHCGRAYQQPPACPTCGEAPLTRAAPGTERGAGDTTILLPSEQPVSDTQFLWQLHNKYIFTPIKSGLMIIDQHVAHERVLYEKALAALDHAAPFSQQLLFPHTFRASPPDFALLGELRPELERLGFLVTLQPPDTVTVEAVPQDVRYGMEEGILQELLEQYKEYAATGLTDHRRCIAASYGCRAAIKAGDKLSPPEMQILIDKLFATSNPYICPHGRPILIKLPLEELDQRFGR